MSEPQFCFASRYSDWHSWFAWRPVRTWDGRWRWLRRIERAMYATHHYLDGPQSRWPEYRVSA